jgi:hypothetical protein
MIRMNMPEATLKLLLQILLAVTVIFVFVPFIPGMPTADNPLDPSWVIGINQGVSQGLAFGRDIIFTYGPYTAISTRNFHPATDHLMMVGSIYLAILYLISLLWIARNSPSLIIVTLIISLTLFKQYPDVLLSSYGILMGVYCYQIIDCVPKNKTQQIALFFFTFLLFTPFGLYPLIKGTIYVLYLAIGLLSMGLLLWFKRWQLALTIPLAIIGSLIFFWLYAGQSMGSLLSYFQSMGEIISGYSEAMIISGNKLEIQVSIVITLCLLGVILSLGWFQISNLYLLSIFGVYLFLSFKSSFVRHDGHAMFGAWALVFSAIVLLNVSRSYKVFLLLPLCIANLFYVDGHYDKTLKSRGFEPILETYTWGMAGLQKRLFHANTYQVEYEKSLSDIKAMNNLPILNGTVDTYPFDQAKLIANGYEWAPRPTLQSYSAYTSKLINLDNDYLLSSKAPDYLLFKVAGIDERYPTLDDGLSWPTILTNYRLKSAHGEFLVLSRAEQANIEANTCEQGSGIFSFDEKIPVPGNGALIFTAIDIKPTLLGKLMNLFFKKSEIRITIELKDGASKNYRLVPRMAEPGFLLSPLIETTEEFRKTISGENLSSSNQISSFSIAPVDRFWQWNREFKVNFKSVNLPSGGKVLCAK